MKKIIIVAFGIAILSLLFVGWKIGEIGMNNQVWRVGYSNIQCVPTSQGERTIQVKIEEGDKIYCPPSDLYEKTIENKDFIKASSVPSCKVNIWLPKPDDLGLKTLTMKIWKCKNEWNIDECKEKGDLIFNVDTKENLLVFAICTGEICVQFNKGSISYNKWYYVGTIQGNMWNKSKDNPYSREYLYVEKLYTADLGLLNPTNIESKIEMKFTPNILILNPFSNNPKPLFSDYKTAIEQGCYLPSAERAKVEKVDNPYSYVEPDHPLFYISEFYYSYPEIYQYKKDGKIVNVVCDGYKAYPVKEIKLENGDVIKIADVENAFDVICCPSTEKPYCKFVDGKFKKVEKEIFVGECNVEGEITEWYGYGDKACRARCDNGKWVKECKVNECAVKGVGVNEYCTYDFKVEKLGFDNIKLKKPVSGDKLFSDISFGFDLLTMLGLGSVALLFLIMFVIFILLMLILIVRR